MRGYGAARVKGMCLFAFSFKRALLPQYCTWWRSDYTPNSHSPRLSSDLISISLPINCKIALFNSMHRFSASLLFR